MKLSIVITATTTDGKTWVLTNGDDLMGAGSPAACGNLVKARLAGMVRHGLDVTEMVEQGGD